MNSSPKRRLWRTVGSTALALFFGIATMPKSRAEEQPPAAPPAAVAPAAPASADERAQKLLAEQAEKDKQLHEEVSAEANAKFEAGKQFFDTFDYENAKHELELAVQLDRTNDAARKLLSRVNDILGDRRARYKSAIQDLYGAAKIQAQEKLIELDNRIDIAKRYISEADVGAEMSAVDRIRRYEQAVNSLERARELIKWMPVEVNTEAQANESTRLINECQKKISAARVNLAAQNKAEAEALSAEHQDNLRRANEKKLNMMVDQARAMQETGRYDEAVHLADQILVMDPINAEAHTIIAVSRDRSHQVRQEWIEKEYQEQYTSNRQRADRMNVPHSDYLVYPDNWREIEQRTSTESRRKAEDPWKQEIRKKLARHVTFEFQDTPLQEALAFLNSLTRVNIILDPKVAAEGADKTPITLRVQDMEMELALKWILRLAGLVYDLRSQAVFVTKPSELAASVELEIYDIRDLTTSITDFPGPRIDLGAAAGGAVNPFEAPPAVSLQAPDLQQLIKEKLLPAEFADPNTSIDESGGKLLVMQRPEIHERIRELLRSFRETQTIQVLTQVRFIDVTDNFLEQIGIHFTGLDAVPNDPGVPNARVDPFQQPSPSGLAPIGGLPGGLPLPSDVQSSPAYQLQKFITRPPFKQDFGGGAANPGPAPILLLRPRLDANFPVNGNANVGPAGAPIGFRRQWWEKWFGSPVLVQGLTQNLIRTNPLATALGQSLQLNPQQGALFQFRFLQSVQASAVLQAVRKDQTADQLLAPRLMQMNNQRAHILVANQRSYIKDYDVSGAVFDPVISSFLTGVVLEVKPTVSSDRRYITLDLRPGTAIELTPPQVIFITSGKDITKATGAINLPIELPNLELRSISTTVTMPDNGTMMFSGLINDRKIDSKSGVPFLSDLPIIGRFFSTNYKERVRRNLLVLVNARIVLFEEEEARL